MMFWLNFNYDSVMNIISSLTIIVGALTLFLFGMKIMSEGLQKAAGDNLRLMVQKFTSNKYAGLLVGMFVTMVIQSSSATTVMVVSFVNSGLLSLVESVGILMGANIGTTVTAWIVTFVGKLSLVKYSIIIIAFCFPFLFIKGNKARNLLEIIAGFAILFMGLGALKNAMPDIEAMPELKEWILAHADGSLLNRLLFVLLGTFITILLQSSSATMALTLTFITENDLPLEIALALVLGENIGTTITAILASLIGNANAKRASRIHLLFNLMGVSWMFFLMPYFMVFVRDMIVPFMENLMPQIINIQNDNDLSRWSLTFFHTCFNLINAIVLINFVGLLVKIATKMVPDDVSKKLTGGNIRYIANQIIGSTEVALVQVDKKIVEMAVESKKVYKKANAIFKSSDPFKQKELLQQVESLESSTDVYGANISRFILEIAQNEMSDDNMRRLLLHFELVQHIEEIGDISKVISYDFMKLNEQHPYPEHYEEKIIKANKLYLSNFDFVIKYFIVPKPKNYEKHFQEVEKMNHNFSKFCRKSHKEIIKSIRKEENMNYKAAGTVRDILLRMENMSNHLFKIVRTNLDLDSQNE